MTGGGCSVSVLCVLQTAHFRSTKHSKVPRRRRASCCGCWPVMSCTTLQWATVKVSVSVAHVTHKTHMHTTRTHAHTHTHTHTHTHSTHTQHTHTYVPTIHRWCSHSPSPPGMGYVAGVVVMHHVDEEVRSCDVTLYSNAPWR